MNQEKKIVMTLVLMVGDGAAMMGSLIVALIVRNRHLFYQLSFFIPPFLLIYCFWFLILFALNLYDPRFLKKTNDFFLNVAIFSIAAFFISVIYFYFIHLPYVAPKTILLLHIFFFCIFFIIWRAAVHFLFQLQGSKETIALVGYTKSLQELAPKIKELYNLSAVFCLPEEENFFHTIFPTARVFSEISLFDQSIGKQKVTSIILTPHFLQSHSRMRELFSSLPLSINYLNFNDVYESLERKVSLDDLDESRFLQKISRSEGLFFQFSKRLFDGVVACVGLILGVILFPCIALAITLDSPGPIFYRQYRVGKNRKLFLLLKFRTMQTSPQTSGTSLWREKDARNITRVGKVLRRLHLDELPQALSILKGEMSFVGPRPEWVEMAKLFEKEIPFYFQRYLVKPGIIGWAQINTPPSHSVAEAAQKFKYDLYYIKNRSWFLDLEIILKTIKLFFW